MRKAGLWLISAAVGAALLCLPGAAWAAALPGPDQPFRTPTAKPGSAQASKKPLGRSGLRRKLRHELQAQGGANGAYVMDLDAKHNAALFSSNAGATRILASNAKLFTTAAALESFGAGRRFTTRLWARGKRTGGRNRRLDGSLALVGSGDPALASGSFAHAHNLPLTRIRPLAAAVRKKGIKKVDGNIKADPSIFDAQLQPHQTGVTQDPGDLGSLSGLEFNSGFASGTTRSSSPAAMAGEALKQALKAEGVKVTGKVMVGPVPGRLKKHAPLAAVDSPALAAMIGEVNTPSNATWAEMLTKRLAAGGKKPGTTARGVQRIESFAKQVGSHVSLENGSGLSRIDVSSAKDVVLLLKAMNKRGDAGVFRHSLALACGSGTVAQRMCGTAAAHNCRTKTGTLRDVSALSGYCNAHGHRIAFAILMNGVSNFDAAHKHQDQMAAFISRYKP
jgi:D-alanyl-D-alanine carboxypeptidase/D-alanyl-D-alanine-endopeptidase (penicillin-binding protein 4)